MTIADNKQHDAKPRTAAELDKLKTEWIADPCWEIEHSDGFEFHRLELTIFRLEYELAQERALTAEYTAFRKHLRSFLGLGGGDAT